MSNEPVAWILNGIIHECNPSDWAKEQYPNQDVIPLYTHPHPDNLGLALSIIDQQKIEIERLKAKTLTDEEIWKELTTVKHTWIATTSVWFEFEKEELTKAIRAILKKANNG